MISQNIVGEDTVAAAASMAGQPGLYCISGMFCPGYTNTSDLKKGLKKHFVD